MHAYALALKGRHVTFHGACGAVTAVRNSDGSFTVSISRPSGGDDIRAYASGADPYEVAVECASLAAHGSGAPVCTSGETTMCGHVIKVTAA
jgi:hypothetical protein